MEKYTIVRRILEHFSLSAEVDDFDTIHDTITRNIAFRGTNLWILIFAIIIASVGLNMNSNPVIIGAMLISPLMGPINGMGYSIATYDFQLLRVSFKNFGFAVIAGLIASTMYFSMSPISTAHSELLARTSPTFFDVIIALFGGMAGILAISSKQKGNVIPGVAIATALMPPLCTAGYGLATGHLNYFFGAMYLFTINTVFIALASVAFSQILKFPIRTKISEFQKKRIHTWTSVVTVLIIVPSIYFGYLLVQNDKFNERANVFVQNIGVIEQNYLLASRIDANRKTIKLVYGGATMTESQKDMIKDKANDFYLPDVKIIFEQGLSFDALNSKNTEVDNLKIEINRLNLSLLSSEARLDSIYSNRLKGRQILNEIRQLYPQILSCSFSHTMMFKDTVQAPQDVQIVVFSTKSNELENKDKIKINKWLQTRLRSENIKVIYEH